MTYRDDFRTVERDSYWSLPRIIIGLLVIVILFYGIGFLATGGDLAIYRFWAPKRANAERQVFEQTQSYVQGKVDYLSRLRMQYQNATGPQKESLRQLIVSEASTVDNNKLPLDLQGFIANLKERP